MEGIHKLSDLDTSKANGPIGVPSFVLKHCADEISCIMKVIFTRSLSTGVLPSDWQKAIISVQFLKRGDVTKLATIGLSPLLLYVQKIIDHIIFHGIMIHLNANNILIENQHRFRPSHSYVIQLITLTEDVLYALDHQKQADIVLLDFAKAFDIVPHRRLLKKLHYYGIRNNIFNWIKTWLTNHTLNVYFLMVTHQSQYRFLQGSLKKQVLGPLMFLLIY